MDRAFRQTRARMARRCHRGSRQKKTNVGPRPRNVVDRARVNGNVITTQPVAAEMDSHGIFLGNVENVSVGENDISAASGILPDPDRVTPHFGVFQFGYRGSRLTMTENSVTNLYHGFAVIPDLADQLSGIWRLRDNAAAGCPRNYVFATGVEVI